MSTNEIHTPEVTIDTVSKVARLARLAVRDEDASQLAGEMATMLGLVARMADVDTADVEPMAHPVGTSQRLREDAVTEHDQRETFQAIAPSTGDGLYLVPRVVE